MEGRQPNGATMSSPAQSLYTPEQYLAMEREAEYKSEYMSGQILAMTGAKSSRITGD